MIPDDEMDELDRIERYLSNQLNPQEQIQFEQQLHQNAELRTNVEHLRQVKERLRTAHIEQRARTTLQQLYRENRKRKTRLSYFWWMGGSALAACFAGLLYLLFVPVRFSGPEEDLLQFRNERSVSGISADTSTVYNRLLSGQLAFQRRDYQQTITDLNVVEKTPNLRPYYREAAQWYLTAAYLYTNQPQLAEPYYHKLQQLDQPVYPVSLIERYSLYVKLQWRKLGL
ncbi:MAG: hypothetical protein ACO1O2_19100 [Larkinella arboricola]